MPRPALLFGRSPFQRDDFDMEADAAEAGGLDSYQVDINALLNEQEDVALAALPRAPRRFLYRGWMLRCDEYARLEAALGELGHQLVTSAARYEAAHLLPRWYPKLAGYTARSVWTETPAVAEAYALAQTLGPGPWLIKDHVKSAKEHGEAVCLVPPGSTAADFAKRCEALLEARGDRFEGGFVVRRYLPFRRFGQTPFGPAFLEYRLFFGRQRLLEAAPYFDFDVDTPDFTAFERLARRIDAPFFAMDLAQLDTGDFAVVELNDGGVSSLPASLDPRELWRGLQAVRLL